jgi:hypothetical protein
MIARSRWSSGQMADEWAGIPGRWLPLVAALLLALAPLPGLAHGGGLELSLSPTDIAAGDEVTVTGEGFAANAPLELHLTGPNGDAHFEDVTADEEGEFTQRVRIPGDTIPGLYLIRAAGAEQEASAELTVGAMAGMAEATEDGAPERDRSAVWKVIAVVLLGGLGLVLARPGRTVVDPQTAT